RLGFPASGRIFNPRPERGMFSSIRCAAKWDGWMPGISHWVITLGDQPHLRPETFEALINLSGKHPSKICQPSHSGHLRHPVVLPKRIFLRLRNSRTITLKEFLAAFS